MSYSMVMNHCQTGRWRETSTHLVPLHEPFPCLDEPLAHDIVVLRRRVAVVVEDVRYVLVHIWDEHAELGAQELVEQLFDAGLYGRP